MKKKLIEVALPLEAINKASSREKSIRYGHPSTMHLWWARRPLAACRAVIFAQLVDDPSAHPDRFPTEQAQQTERERLFKIIEDLVLWENTTNETVLEAAREEIRKSCDGNLPTILDPFAGGGSIPLEAQRLGLEAHASDLNPIPVLINKALIEIPPRFADKPSVHAGTDGTRTLKTWNGAQGLAADVRYYGEWLREQALARIGHLYPTVDLPADQGGGSATVIAWIWARTLKCPNPACGADMPLVTTFELSKRKNKKAWIEPHINRDDKTIGYTVRTGEGIPPDPPKVGRGAKFRCLLCEQVAEDQYLKNEGKQGRLGVRLIATIAEGDRTRVYRSPDEHQEAIAATGKPNWRPEGAVPDDPRNVWCKIYGFDEYSDLFTNRQLTALTTFSDLVGAARDRCLKDAVEAGMADDPSSLADGGAGALAYADAVATYLAFAVDRESNEMSTICTWDSNATKLHIRATFARQALPMTWDFAEANPFANSTGSIRRSIESVARCIELLPASVPGHAVQADSSHIDQKSLSCVVATDPPYYDNIGYADLSDFFYVWMRPTLGVVWPDELGTMLTPKASELIASPYRHGGKQAAQEHFETGLADAFIEINRVQDSNYPMTTFYAFKQSETDDEGTRGSTGWETMLEGLLSAGFAITGTWPIRSERGGRMISIGTNALASSIVLVCRPRPQSATITDRQGFVRALQTELPQALHDLQNASIAPVDLRQAAIGPGMAVFSRFAKVVESTGEPMRVRDALGLINQLLSQVLGDQESDFDPETRWAIQWFSQFFGQVGPYGTAEQLSVSMNVSVSGMVASGILESGGGKVRLLRRDELPSDWDPRTDSRTPVWEVTQHLVKRLEEQGEMVAGTLLAQLGGLGEQARMLAYRLYTICEETQPTLAGPYNALVGSWSEIQIQARQSETVQPANEQQSFET